MAGKTTRAGRTVTDQVAALLLVSAEGAEYGLTEPAGHANRPTSTTHRLIQELIQSLLAFPSPADVEKTMLPGLFPFSPNTVVSARQFRRALAITRATHWISRGLPVTHPQEKEQPCTAARSR